MFFFHIQHEMFPVMTRRQCSPGHRNGVFVFQSPKPAGGQYGIFDIPVAPPIDNQIFNLPEALPVEIFYEFADHIHGMRHSPRLFLGVSEGPHPDKPDKRQYDDSSPHSLTRSRVDLEDGRCQSPDSKTHLQNIGRFRPSMFLPLLPTNGHALQSIVLSLNALLIHVREKMDGRNRRNHQDRLGQDVCPETSLP